MLIFERGGATFVFNFSPDRSYNDYFVKVSASGKYRVALSTDEMRFGGYDRISKEYEYLAKKNGKIYEFPIYLPPRCAMVLVKVK